MKTSKTPATMTTGMQNLMAALPKDGTAKRCGGGQLLAAKKLQALGMVVIDGSGVRLAPKPAKAKAAKAKAKPAKKAPKAKAASKAWPSAFPAKATIRKMLTEDRDARLSAAQTLTARVALRRPGLDLGGASGWMSSQLVRGLAVSAKISKGEKLSGADDAWLAQVIPSYARQLARVAREVAVAKDPSLAKIAAVYGLREGGA